MDCLRLFFHNLERIPFIQNWSVEAISVDDYKSSTETAQDRWNISIIGFSLVLSV
jgi:hypothetical protein